MATNFAPYRAMSLKQPGNLRQAIRDAQKDSRPLVGVGCGLGTLETAKMVAAMPADWAWVDAEHTPFGQSMLSSVIQTINYYSEGKMFPIVRVPNHEHDWIAYALDAGAAGIIVPHTETVEQVRATIDAAKFGPIGKRSYPPFALVPGIQDKAPDGKSFLDVANEHAAIIPQIESKLGVENLEAIMQIPEVDLIFIGMGDLLLDLGLPLNPASQDPAFVECLEKIFALAKKYNKPLGGFLFEGMLADKFKRGYRLVASVSDYHALAFGMLQGLGTGRGILDEARKELLEGGVSSTSLHGKAAEPLVAAATNGSATH